MRHIESVENNALARFICTVLREVKNVHKNTHIPRAEMFKGISVPFNFPRRLVSNFHNIDVRFEISNIIMSC